MCKEIVICAFFMSLGLVIVVTRFWTIAEKLGFVSHPGILVDITEYTSVILMVIVFVPLVVLMFRYFKQELRQNI